MGESISFIKASCTCDRVIPDALSSNRFFIKVPSPLMKPPVLLITGTSLLVLPKITVMIMSMDAMATLDLRSILDFNLTLVFSVLKLERSLSVIIWKFSPIVFCWLLSPLILLWLLINKLCWFSPAIS